MSRYRRAHTPGATFFFTVVPYRRKPFLYDPDVRIALREAIAKVRDQYLFHIDGWVLLPDLPWSGCWRNVQTQCRINEHFNGVSHA